jgi:Mg-chelatase subunit ChlD
MAPLQGNTSACKRMFSKEDTGFLRTGVLHFLAALLFFLGFENGANAQFTPATGDVDTGIATSAAASATHNVDYSVALSGKTLTISRPGLSNYVYTAPGGSSAVLTYAFLGPSTVLLKTVDANAVNVRLYLQLVNMETFTAGDLAVGLINRQFFTTQSPNLQLSRNSDGQVLFTYISTNDAAINNTFEIDLYRTDTGAYLCGLADFSQDSGNVISASVSGTDTSILVDRDPFPDLSNTCPLPVANLTVAPDPLDFGTMLSTTTATDNVTLSNPGTDVIDVTAIGTAGAFSAVGFTPLTLDPGDSETVSVLFNPAGVAGAFNEAMPITRNPAVGAAFINVEAVTTPPVPALSVSSTARNFGCVDVGTSPTLTFTITSSGQLPVTVASITGPITPEFSLTTPPGFNVGIPIPAGTSFTFTVTFSPGAAGPFSDSITIDSNDPANPTVIISLSGTGHVPAADFVIDPTVTNLNYGDVEVGYRFGKGVRIVNNGDVDLSFQVEVLGDSRFGVSTDATTPGPGVRGPISVTIPGTLTPCGGGTASEIILRVTFDAMAPDGGPYNGTLRINNILNDPSPPAQPVDIALEGVVVPAKTVDVALVLDRSGSMSEPMAIGTKESAVRSASRLFVELMRPDVGDRLSLVQFNDNVDVFMPMTAITAGNQSTFVSEVEDPTNLAPSGSTSIAGGLYEALQEFDDPTKDIRAAFVVSDGKDNTPYPTPSGDVTLSTLTVPAGIGIHALALGTATNTDLGILTGIANSTGGTAMPSDNVTSLGIFDIEKFFLQTATTILGGVTTLDPVSRINPGQEQVWQVPLIPADKSVSFVLMYKNGVLPYQIEAPDGTVYPTGAPPAGFGQYVLEPPNARVLRLQLPTDEPHRYAGIWKVRVHHGGKLIGGRSPDDDPKSAAASHSIQMGDPVDYALAVSVFSNLRLLAYVSPQPLHLGDPITVTAVLSEEEIPVTGATVDVQVRFPDSVTYRSLDLHDDGAHNDGDANDGVYANVFTETLQEGHYQFAYHAFGQSAREGDFVRETFVGQYVTRPGRIPDDETDDPGAGDSDDCCNWVVISAILLFLILVTLWLCCWRNRFAISRPPSAIAHE